MKGHRNNLLIAALLVIAAIDWCSAQRGSFNFAKKSAGEREGDLSPTAIAGVSIACVAGVAGLMVTVFFCYYVYKKQKEYQDSFNNGNLDPSKTNFI